MRRCAAPILLSLLVACSYDVVTTAVPAPELQGVTPAQGVQDQAQRVEIQGQNLLPLIAQDLSQPDGLRVDLTFAAWIGEVALQQVVYVDDEHLTATVPAGVAPGVYALKVETPHGLQASLADAYEVLPSTGPAISSVLPADLINDQAGLIDVVGSGFDSGLSAELQPASGATVALTLSNLNSAGFTASVPQGTAAGSYALQVTTGSGRTASLPDALRVWDPAILVASIGLSPTTAHTGQSVTVTVRVRNDGGSDAVGVQVALPTTVGSGTVTHVSGPLPASASIAPGSAQDFALTYTAQGSGQVVFGAQASGSNVHSLRPVVSNLASSEALDVVVGASLSASLSAPLAVLLDQVFDVTLTVQNTGQGQATVVTPTLDVTGSGSLSLSAGPLPATADLDGGQSQIFTYTYQATALGSVSFAADVSGFDVVNSATVSAPTASAGPMTIQEESALVAAWQTPSATVLHGQSVDVTLRATNTGGSQVTGVAPTALQITGSTGTTCAAPTPASVDLAADAFQDFIFACTVGSTSGAWALIAGAQGTDTFSGQPTTALPVETAAFVAVGPAALALQWQALPAQVATGQSFAAVLRATNSGGSGALAVAPTGFAVSGATGTACTGPTPASADLAAAAIQDFTYDCTAGDTAGSAQLSAGASATAAVGGAALTAAAVDSSSVQVLAGAALAVISVTSPATDVYQGQAGLQVSVLVENTGEIAANLTSAASWLSFAAGAVGVTAEYTVVPAGGNPTSVAGGAQQTLQFTVAVSDTATAGAIVIDAVATGTDAVSGITIQSAGAATTLSWNIIANSRPVACFSAPSVVETGVAFTLDASCSADAEDALADLQVAWDLDGDGTYETAPTATKTLSHSIATAGAARIGLEVRDLRGARGYVERWVFAADAARIIVVTNANAAGAGSLAQAIADANANPNVDTIRFDTAAFPGTPTTIVLSAALTISQPVYIVGHSGVRVQRDRGVFNVTAAGVTLADLEIEGNPSQPPDACVIVTGADFWLVSSKVVACDTGLRLSADSAQIGPGNVLDGAEFAIEVTAGTGHLIHENVVTNCSTTACLSFADGTSQSDVVGNIFAVASVPLILVRNATSMSIHHNTLHGSTGYGLVLGGSGHDVKNNIFTSNTAGAISDASGLTEASNDYNACFGNGGTACGATGGPHIITDDPLYVDAAGGDFRLQSGSPCVDSGLDLGLDVNGAVPGDFNGAAPDMGAQER